MVWIITQITVERAVSVLDYILQDYGDIVVGGEIKDEYEWKEINDFALQLKKSGYTFADTLIQLMNAKVPPDSLKKYVERVKSRLLKNVSAKPPVPDLLKGKVLYERYCASCHGKDGKSDTEIAATLDPKPRVLWRNDELSILRVFNAITYGIEGTSMPPFPNIPEDERWHIAFYVLSLGREASKDKDIFPLSINDITTLTDKDLARKLKDMGIDDPKKYINALRTSPQDYFSQKPKDRLIKLLNLTSLLIKKGRFEDASKTLFDAYFEGFEPLEGVLPRNKVVEIERKFSEARKYLEIRSQKAYDEVLSLKNSILSIDEFNPMFALIGAIGIIFREGLEVVLIIAAILAVMTSLGYRKERIYVHLGWISALISGVALWILAQTAIRISGISRELIEGFSAFLAAVVLFHVGHWMLAYSDAQKWKEYIKKSVSKSLSKASMLGLFGLSFIAAFREVLETILFYQALYFQISNATLLLAGVLIGIVSLLAIVWLIFFLRKRLPISSFFTISGGLLLGLCFTLTGKGIRAFQEAGILPSTNIPWMFSVDILGIYPYAETLMAQFLIFAGTLAVFVVKLYQENVRRKEILLKIFELEKDIKDITSSVENVRCTIGNCILETQIDKVKENLKDMERVLKYVESKLMNFEEVFQKK